MKKLISVLVCLVLVSGVAAADPVLDEKTVKGISEEIKQAVKNNDLSVFRKYLYRGSKLVVDLDPSTSAGLTEVSYEDYMNLMQLALPLMRDADIQDEVISLSIDKAKNQATIKEKSNVTTYIKYELSAITIHRLPFLLHTEHKYP